jgi:putative transposase
MAKIPKSISAARGRNRVPEYYRSLDTWPGVSDEKIDDSKARRRYKRLRDAMQLYLEHKPLSDVEMVAGVTARRFLRLFDRCLDVAPDGRIWGLRALIRGTRVGPMRRRKPLTFHADARAGFQGAFRKLLEDHPQIERDLIATLLRRGSKNFQPNRMHFRGAHRAFIAICIEHGIAAADYPLCTKTKATAALRGWLANDFIPRHGRQWIEREHGRDAAQIYDYQGGDGQAKRLPIAYSAWELDEVTIDVEGIYQVPNATGDWEEIELRRSFVVRVIDVGTGAKLANRLILAPQASAEDIAVVLWDAVNGPAINEELTESGLLAGAGYPANIIPELRFAVPSVLYLDNALAHLADHVRHLVEHLWGAMVKLGRPGTPQDRPHIESDFSAQARRLLHQMPGTTGSGSGDPIRKTAAVPVKDRIPMDRLAWAIDAYCANANILGAAASGYIAPLVRLQRQLASGALKPLYLPADKRHSHYFGKPQPVNVKADLRSGRRPYINFLYCRYSNDQLERSIGLKDERMWVRADFRNLQTVLLFDDENREFGFVTAKGRWGKFPHDVRIRKLFGRLKRANELGPRADDDPLDALFSYLRERAVRDRNAAQQLAYLLTYLKAHARELQMPLPANQRSWEDGMREVQDHALIPVENPAIEIENSGPKNTVSGAEKSAAELLLEDVRQTFSQILIPRRVIRR